MNAAELARQEKQGMRVHKAQSAVIVAICEEIDKLLEDSPEHHEAILSLSRAIANIGGRP